MLSILAFSSISRCVSSRFLGLVLKEFLFGAYIDKVGLVCLLMLFCCGCIALFYCHHYFGDYDKSSLLYPLMV